MSDSIQDIFSNFMPFIHEGQVVATDDPDQMGRVKAWVPALDGENFEIDSLPWVEYASPLSGFTVDYPAGDGAATTSQSAYGFWAIPKMGATVYLFCVAGDPARRAYFASSTRLHRNRSLPAGRNVDGYGAQGPWGDAGDGLGALDAINPAYTNLRTQFNGNLTASEAITRGVYERQVAQAADVKDGKEGYSKTPVATDTYLDSQTSCWVSPGRHAIIMQDDPHYARFRLKTAKGAQIILDDANERIYISTAKGRSWLEMDEDGHINIFGADSYSVRSGMDINFYADRDVNIQSGRNTNITAAGDIKAKAGGTLHLKSFGDAFLHVCGSLNQHAEDTLRITVQSHIDINSLAGDITAQAGRGIDLQATENIVQQGAEIHLNGPAARDAAEAECATDPDGASVVPGFEPWTRPVTSGTRGKYWAA